MWLCRVLCVGRTSGETEPLLADRLLLSAKELWRREPRAEPELLQVINTPSHTGFCPDPELMGGDLRVYFLNFWD